MLVLVVSPVIGQEAIKAPGSTCITVKFDFLGFLYCTLANYCVVHLVLVLGINFTSIEYKFYY